MRAKVDDNQQAIVECFRKMGATVQPLHQVGDGCTDLVIGLMGLNVMVEVKDGSKIPSKRKLTQDQVIWHSLWRGWKAIVECEDDCIRLVTAIKKIALQIKDWPEEI